MDESARRAQTSKGGPRALTITPNIVGGSTVNAIVNNCPTCDLPAGLAIWDEDGNLGERDLLVHGWYILETDINIFWQQVNPRDACTTDPLFTGRSLIAGACTPFFVDGSQFDSVIVIRICPQLVPSTACGVASSDPEDFVQGFVRISRSDTIRKMADTGDDVSAMVPPPSSVCNE